MHRNNTERNTRQHIQTKKTNVTRPIKYPYCLDRIVKKWVQIGITCWSKNRSASLPHDNIWNSDGMTHVQWLSTLASGPQELQRSYLAFTELQLHWGSWRALLAPCRYVLESLFFFKFVWWSQRGFGSRGWGPPVIKICRLRLLFCQLSYPLGRGESNRLRPCRWPLPI